MVSLVFITNVPTPYKTSRFETLARRDDVDLHVIYANSRTHRHEFNFEQETPYGVELKTSYRIPLGDSEFMIDLWSLRRLLSVKADVFVVGGWNYTAAWSALFAGRLRDIPVAVISPNIDQGSRFSSIVVPPIVRRFDAHFALSTAAQKHLVSLGVDPSTVTVLPNSIDVQRFRQSLDDDTQAELKKQYGLRSAFTILYVGRLSEQKGVGDLLTAVGNLRKINTQLLIVGDGPRRSALERRAKQELPDKVTFTGQLPNDELPNYYRLADIFVLPTHRDTWGLVLNEAMVCETPVITTTAAGAVGDLVRDGETGLVVPPGDPAALCRAIDQLSKDEERRAELIQAGLECASEFSPEAYATRLIEVVEGLLIADG